MSTPTPDPPPTFNIAPEALVKSAENLVNYIEQAATRLVISVTQNATFDNVIRPLVAIDNEVKARVQYMALFQAVAVNLVDKAYLALFQNKDLFALVNTVYSSLLLQPAEEERSAEEEDIRLLTRFYRMFVDNGMELTGPAYDRFVWISRR